MTSQLYRVAGLLLATMAVVLGARVAQAGTFTGTVVNHEGIGVKGLIVRILSPDGVVHKTGLTDGEGKYSLKVEDHPVLSIEFTREEIRLRSYQGLNGKADQSISIVLP
jgi:hypothetical protein